MANGGFFQQSIFVQVRTGISSADHKGTVKDVGHTATAAGNTHYTATANTIDPGSTTPTVNTDHSATTAPPVNTDPLSFLEKLELDGKC